mmetsp:Transcript_40680/g.113002  ORF Transcript_40680/g.113002 Transcript_40680/m.113002 type:complete len:209 (+) Transcript_40680:1556-2182(+)
MSRASGLVLMHLVLLSAPAAETQMCWAPAATATPGPNPAAAPAVPPPTVAPATLLRWAIAAAPLPSAATSRALKAKVAPQPAPQAKAAALGVAALGVAPVAGGTAVPAGKTAGGVASPAPSPPTAARPRRRRRAAVAPQHPRVPPCRPAGRNSSATITASPFSTTSTRVSPSGSDPPCEGPRLRGAQGRLAGLPAARGGGTHLGSSCP